MKVAAESGLSDSREQFDLIQGNYFDDIRIAETWVADELKKVEAKAEEVFKDLSSAGESPSLEAGEASLACESRNDSGLLPSLPAPGAAVASPSFAAGTSSGSRGRAEIVHGRPTGAPFVTVKPR